MSPSHLARDTNSVNPDLAIEVAREVWARYVADEHYPRDLTLMFHPILEVNRKTSRCVMLTKPIDLILSRMRGFGSSTTRLSLAS